MNTLNMPGFTADKALYPTSRSYRSRLASDNLGSGQIMPQMRGGGMGFPGTFGGSFGFWCELGCAGIASLCIAASLGNPLAVAACVAGEIKCLSSC